MKKVGLDCPAPASIPPATTKATDHWAMLSLNVEKAVQRMMALKVALDQLKNAVPLSLQYELEVILQELMPKGTLPQ